MKATFKSLGKDFGHQKTKFLQKYGSTEKTVDAEFEEHRENYEKLVKNISSIQRDVSKQNEHIKGMVSPLLSLSETLDSFYEEPMQNGSKFRQSVMALDVAVREYLDRQKELAFNLDEYMTKLNTLKKKIGDRDNILLDHDKYKTKVIKLTASGKELDKLEKAEKKFEEKKNLYKQLNEEAIQEIRTFYDSRFSDFKTEYELLVSSMYELFRAAQEAYQSLMDGGAPPSRPPAQPPKPQPAPKMAEPVQPPKPQPPPKMAEPEPQPTRSLPAKPTPPEKPTKEETKYVPPQKPVPQKPLPTPAPQPQPQPTHDKPLPQPTSQSQPQAQPNYRRSLPPQPQPAQKNDFPSSFNNSGPTAPPPLPAKTEEYHAENPFEVYSPQSFTYSSNNDPFQPAFDFQPAPTSTNLPQLPQKPNKPTSHEANYGQNPPLPRKDSVGNRGSMPPVPKKENQSLQDQVTDKMADVATDAVARAATNPEVQKKVGNAIANQATNHENQKRMGDTIASRTDNPILKSLASNSSVQSAFGSALAKASTNTEVQKRVGESVANTAKDEETKKKVGNGIKSGVSGMFSKLS